MPRRRRDELREVAAGVIASVIALVAYGLLVPTTFEVLTLDHESISRISDRDWADLLAFLGAMAGGFAAGIVGWIVLIERRRPWPLGPRAGRSGRSAIGLAVAMGASYLAGWGLSSVLVDGRRSASGLYGIEGDDQALLFVAVPADAAYAGVAGLAGLGLAFVLVDLGSTVWRRRGRPGQIDRDNA